MVIHSGTGAHSGHYYTIAKDDINSDEKPKWNSYNDTMVSEVDQDFILTISKQMKYDTPYILFYKERTPGLRTQRLATEGNCINDYNIVDKDNKANIPTTLKKFVEMDNESFLKEKEYIAMKANKNKSSSQDFNFAMLRELQKHLMKTNDKGFDEARTMGPGGFGNFGGNNNFFGGGGGI